MHTVFLNEQSVQNSSVKHVYRYIYQHGPISRANIIKGTQLNRGKVDRSLLELIDKEYILLNGHGESEGGRPPSLYQINAKKSYIIGIQITRAQTKIVLFDLLLNQVDKKVITMTDRHTPEVCIKETIEFIHLFMKVHHFSIHHLLGIGIGAIGPLDRKKGIILDPESFLASGWINVPIVSKIKEEFPVLILLEDGANAAALGEYKDHECRNVINITVGWSWGCGVILNGRLLEVEGGDGSGYGHMVIDINGKQCFCGKRGCAVAYTSLFSILEEIKERSPETSHRKFNHLQKSSMDEILIVLMEPNPLVEEVIANSSRYLGVAVANLATVFHSELVILNGAIINGYPGYYEKVINHALQHINTTKFIQFKKGEFIGDSAVVGVATQVFEFIMANEDQMNFH